MEQTKTESRKEFIKYCLINPILEASKKGIEFNLSDNHVGMSLFHILVDKGYVVQVIKNVIDTFVPPTDQSNITDTTSPNYTPSNSTSPDSYT